MLPAALLAEDSEQLVRCAALSLIKVLPSQRLPQRAKCLSDAPSVFAALPQ